MQDQLSNPFTIPYEGNDEQLHTEANNYTCDNPECPCQDDYAEYWQPERDRTQDETGTHAPDCRCSWCEPQDRNATTQCADGSWW